ncbi:hypothetical protein CFHF_14440 [Caulobacter flavus]|uniref:Uncharacterized protein n=1 Tax=Caulobacter flavus TaxID=1679497 RepID=A0A2N5CSE4_9CAUL|nr:hypothetical protein C1707_23805 [Caulobacter flavus]PLR13377.1 hypothetical protein CFHF_14440 [Caulobacter flavus]
MARRAGGGTFSAFEKAADFAPLPSPSASRTPLPQGEDLPATAPASPSVPSPRRQRPCGT